MNRMVFVLSFALFCSSAQATPTVGDFVLFDTTVVTQGHTVQGTIQLQLLEEDSGKFLQRTTVTVVGRSPKVKEDWKAKGDFVTDDMIENALTNCAGHHGIRDMVQVPAGTFDSCGIPMDNDSEKGTIWVAKVPLGVVRAETYSKADGTEMTMELRAAH